MKFETIFFDLDGTLYRNETGLWQAIKNRIDHFLHDKMGFKWEDIPKLRQTYYKKYGTTLKGLQIHYAIDPDEYLKYTHDLPLEQYLKKDPELHTLLKTLPQEKWVFTNSDSSHVNRVLRIVGIEDCFSGIIDINATDFYCKPDPIAFQKAFEIAHVKDLSTCVFIDDLIGNIIEAQKMGIFSIFVSGETHQENGALHQIRHIHELKSIPVLWD